MSKIIGIMLVKNEADRYLRRVLSQMTVLCDRLLVLDDGSTDSTPLLCEHYGAKVYRNATRETWEKNELALRKALWNRAVAKANPGDWIICLDADETFHPAPHVPEIIRMVQKNNPNVDGLVCPLYDMWSPSEYRDDELWNAHTRDWCMIVKYDPDKEYVWRETPLHCGRFPLNAVSVAARVPLNILHWGWAQHADRMKKYERYMKVDPEGKSGSLAQYKSILDLHPVLRRII